MTVFIFAFDWICPIEIEITICLNFVSVCWWDVQ